MEVPPSNCEPLKCPGETLRMRLGVSVRESSTLTLSMKLLSAAFRGTIDSIEGRTQESGDAHHDGTRKICLLLQTLVEVVHDAQRGESIDLERTHEMRFVDVFEQG